jgi:uncharacterized membrane protein YfcA
MELPLSELALHIALGFVIGAFIGMTGIGGGVLVEPALIHLLGIAPVSAVGTGLAFSCLVKTGGALSHIRLRTICGRRARLFLMGAVPGLLLSSAVVNHLVRAYDPSKVNEAVRTGIGSVLILSATILALEALLARGKSGQLAASVRLSQRSVLPRRSLGVAAGVVTGSVIGATSIGGGVLTLPALILLLGAHPRQAVGTSIVISVTLAALGASVYILNGNFIPSTVLLMFGGGLPGVLWGSRFAVRIPIVYLRVILIGMVTLCGLSFFVAAS